MRVGPKISRAIFGLEAGKKKFKWNRKARYEKIERCIFDSSSMKRFVGKTGLCLFLEMAIRAPNRENGTGRFR